MEGANEERYGIGTVARRTGLSAPNIRMWEARYGAVEPIRTPSNRRLYSPTDLERLKALQLLTGQGHPISRIANLSLDRLQEMLAEEALEPLPPTRTTDPAERARLLVVGRDVEALLRASGPVLESEVVAAFADLDEAVRARRLPAADLVVIETDTLFPETVAAVREFVGRAKTGNALLLYRFAASKTARALAGTIPGLQLMTAPVAKEQLHRACLVQLRRDGAGNSGPEIEDGPLPERLFSSDQLVRLSGLSTTVACECPQHLAELIKGLSAFEKYSHECEDRNPQDALLHAFLHRTTAKLRRSMEEALQHVVRTEGIPLD